ncbi:dihydropteroate synthase, partial [Chromobacterium vaccinii]
GASVGAALESARRGAAVIRVHDVKATRQALQLWQALRGC